MFAFTSEAIGQILIEVIKQHKPEQQPLAINNITLLLIQLERAINNARLITQDEIRAIRRTNANKSKTSQ